MKKLTTTQLKNQCKIPGEKLSKSNPYWINAEIVNGYVKSVPMLRNYYDISDKQMQTLVNWSLDLKSKWS